MNRVGIGFGIIQFFFITTWTVYVIFLPQLLAQVGIGKEWLLWLLMADQLVFAGMDLALGIAADRVVRTVGRLGPWMVAISAVSCLAFLLLPLAAGAGSPVLLLGLVLLWTLTSSALRAPPLVLLGKYVPAPQMPWMASLLLSGVAVAGAVAPYLTVALRGTDPRLPFALSSLALLLAVSSLLWAEKHLAPHAAPGTLEPQAVSAGRSGPRVQRDSKAVPDSLTRGRTITSPVLLFFAAVALLGLGFQLHFALNAAPQFLRFAKPVDLEYLMPVFWIGFNLLMFPAVAASKRVDGLKLMATGGLVAALASWSAAGAGSLEVLVISQFVAGSAWGVVLMSALAGAIAIGQTGREGAATGGLFSLLALATFARMALVASQLPKDAAMAAVLAWLPAALWALAGMLLLALHRPTTKPTGA